MAGTARSLEYAVLASLALHGALLYGISLEREPVNRPAAAPEPIAARLAEPEPEPARPAPESKSIPKKSISTKSISTKSISESASASAPALEEAIEVKATPPIATQIPVLPPAEVISRAEAASPPADAATVGQYRLQLIGAAKRFKRYPDAARENNWSGNVVVGVAVGADGRPEASVRKSSGRPVLDQQALEMFQQAARAVPVPPALRGREFNLEVLAIYGLED